MYITAVHFALSTSLRLKFPLRLICFSLSPSFPLSLKLISKWKPIRDLGAFTWIHLIAMLSYKVGVPNILSSFVPADPPILDPVFQDVRSRNYQMVTLRCTILRSNPPRLTDTRWFRNGDFIRMPMPDLKETPELKFKLEPTNNGSYVCRVSNTAGTSTCTFNVSGE